MCLDTEKPYLRISLLQYAISNIPVSEMGWVISKLYVRDFEITFFFSD